MVKLINLKSLQTNSWEAIENDVLVDLMYKHLQAQGSQTIDRQQVHVKQKAMVFDDEEMIPSLGQWNCPLGSM